MMTDFFPERPAATPTIYAYSVSNPEHAGELKVGYTEVGEGDPTQRIKQQTPGGFKGLTVELVAPAQRADGTAFTDHDVHRRLRARGHVNTANEWFRCTVADVKAAVLAVRERTENLGDRTEDFKPRPEQREAVAKTAAYFRSAATDRAGHTPHFLWNCKMRFGKTFASYQLAREMGWRKVLVLTFKPAVRSAWQEDLETHRDFEGWQFASKDSATPPDALDRGRPIVYFGSF